MIEALFSIEQIVRVIHHFEPKTTDEINGKAIAGIAMGKQVIDIRFKALVKQYSVYKFLAYIIGTVKANAIEAIQIFGFMGFNEPVAQGIDKGNDAFIIRIRGIGNFKSRIADKF